MIELLGTYWMCGVTPAFLQTHMCRTCALYFISLHYSIFSGRTRRHAGSGHIQDVATRAFRARVVGTDIAVRVRASWRKQSDDSQDRPRTYMCISIHSMSLSQITDITLLQLERDQR